MKIIPPLTYRRAVPDDARGLSHLGRATFLATFAYDHPGGPVLDFLDDAHSPERYLAWVSDPAYAIFVGTTPLGVPAAYALMTPPDHPHLSRSGDIELKRIYVLPDWQGSGEAGRLLELITAEAEHRGAARLLLAVYEANARARRFYERQGFEQIGVTTFMVGDVEMPDLVYARSIA